MLYSVASILLFHTIFVCLFVLLENRVCFSDIPFLPSPLSLQPRAPLTFEKKGKGSSHYLLMYGCMPLNFNVGLICWNCDSSVCSSLSFAREHCIAAHLSSLYDGMHMERIKKKTMPVVTEHWFGRRFAWLWTFMKSFLAVASIGHFVPCVFAAPASQHGLMNRLILMPHSPDRHCCFPTKDSHSCNLGEPDS